MINIKSLVMAALLLPSIAVAQTAPKSWTNEWPDTNFDQSSVSFVEIMSGGPPKDGIPALDGAEFGLAIEETGIDAREPVVTIELDGQTPRAYPIRYLTWHEIVNDRIGDVPVSVTFCPLCNSAIVFDGRLDGKEYTFGVSGKLRNSDMIMYDRQTESWWQQFTGEAIVGSLLGSELTVVASWMESFAEFSARNPEGLVMKQPTHIRRPYGQNPYVSYDGSRRPFLYSGEVPPHDIAPLSRVVRVKDTAWPLQRLRDEGEIIEDGVRLVWSEGQASALDSRKIGDGKEVGTVRAFDATTGVPIVYEVVFAFAFHAFAPDGKWHLGDS